VLADGSLILVGDHQQNRFRVRHACLIKAHLTCVQRHI
jgi:hypothetical protein